MLHVMPFMGPDLEINSILFYSVASLKIECQNFSYVYRSRKHCECKYIFMKNLNVIRFSVVNLIFYVDVNFYK